MTKTNVWVNSLSLFTRAEERRMGFCFYKIEFEGSVEISLKECSLGHPKSL